MPFGLKLKKTRRYYVSGKNSYVARIQLLDNTILECTLSPENSGSDCLAMVAQKLQLEENEFFGLQYINKNYKLRWVDLDKPLKKQLDKNANDPMLRFGIMLYAFDVHSLQQEITRYLYFLQLRSDIIEGILPCSPEQAVLLASYAVQAEFGDHIPYTHTVEFLKDFVILPKNLTSEADSLTELTQEVANQHRNHQSMPPDVAELAYINEASQLDGYGQESYPAKDESGNDLLLGASFLGISVKHLNGQPTVYFKWNDIRQTVHNKRLFGIESVRTQDTIQFQMEDAETAKYVCRMFITKHKFYKLSMAAMQGGKEASLDGGRLIPKNFQIPLQRKPTLTRRSAEKAQYNINAFTNARANSLQERITVQPEEGHFTQSQLSLDGPTIEHAYSNGGLAVVDGGSSVYSAPSTTSLNQGLYMHASPASSNPSISSSEPTKQELLTTLPQYRPSPDYNEALVRVHNRLNTIGDQSQSLSNLGRAHAYQQPETMVYSQPEIRQPNQYNSLNPYGTHLNLNLGSPTYSYVDASSESLPYVPAMSLRSNPGMTHTYSTPELTSQHMPTTQEYINSKLLLDHYKPPPAYPRNSTSTPDLPRQSLQYQNISSSSPDLMSRRLLGQIPTLQEPVPMQSTSMTINVNSASGSVSTSQHSIPLAAIQTMNLNTEQYLETLSQVSPAEHTIHISRDVQTDITHEDIIDDDTFEEGQLTAHSSETAASSPTEMRENSPKVPIYNIENSNSTAFIGLTADLQAESPDVASDTETSHASQAGSAAVTLQDSVSTEQSHTVPQHIEADVKIVKDIPTVNIEDDPKTPGYVQIIAASGDSAVDVDSALDRRKVAESSITMGKTVALEPQESDAEATVVADRGDKVQLQQRISDDSVITPGTSGYSTSNDSDLEEPLRLPKADKLKGVHIGPLKLAAMNGLTLSRLVEIKDSDEDDSPAPKDGRWKVLEQKLADGLVFTEYEQIPKKKPNAVYSTAQKPENSAKNRFQDVLPYEDTRVKLARDKRNPSGYINASLIKVTVASEELHYIAAQGPLHETVIDWWNMIWEQGVQVIVMLTAEQENGKQKSFRYWPQFSSSKNTLDIGPFKLTAQFSNDSGVYVTSGVTLRHKSSGEQRTVWHLQFTNWPHQGCPDDVSGFLAFLEEIQSVCRHANSMVDGDVSPPVLVHCSAGVGRTGVVILADTMIACLEYNEDIAVPKMLSILRKQRMLMVQTVGQYIFVYRTLIQFLKNSRLI
ncbi:tyrosine-protein phosphatase non-receptor type 14-like [Ptychodera flava]|uniref:tyrosine-protein phosphatase non-receptor type 14-like n=1 Tax=Ptychodera flava TaxID=63121 RepID=UPI00396A1184